MTTGKTIALTRRTFVGKVMSLLFNMLSRLVITFLPRSKRLLISWLQSPSAVILEPPKIKSETVSTVSPSISHEVMGPDAMVLVFWMLSFKPTFSVYLVEVGHGIQSENEAFELSFDSFKPNWTAKLNSGRFFPSVLPGCTAWCQALRVQGQRNTSIINF